MEEGEVEEEYGEIWKGVEAIEKCMEKWKGHATSKREENNFI